MEKVSAQFSVIILHSGAPEWGVPNYEPEKGYEIIGVYTHKHKNGQIQITAVVKKKEAVNISLQSL